MALEDCIERALKAGTITNKQAEQIRQRVQAGSRELAAIDSFIREAMEKERKASLQALAMKRNLKDVTSHPKGIDAGVMALLVRDLNGLARYSNVDQRRKAILFDVHSRMAEGIERYRPKRLGFKSDGAGLRKVVRELHGERTGDVDAVFFARQFAEAAEDLRIRHNAAGGNIPKRKDWHLPQRHNSRKVAAVPFDEWRGFILPRLAHKRIFHDDGRVMGREDLETFLKGLYEQFVEDAGVTVRDIPRGVPNRVDHRRLTFRDATAFLEYADEYGEPDHFHSMMDHLEKLASDTALMEILGPDPDAAMRRLGVMAKREPKSTLKGIGRTIGPNPFKVYEVVTGRINQTENEWIAKAGSTVRNLLSSAQLGGAAVSSLTDVWTTRSALAANGIPAWRHLDEIFRQMNPASKADRLLAVKMGLGAEAWITRALAAARFQDIDGTGLSAKIADAVFKASLLTPWTQGMKATFGLGVMTELGQFVGRGTPWEKLPSLLRANMERYGIGSDHWNKVLRRAPTVEREGAALLVPREIMEPSREEVRKLAHAMREAGEAIEAEAKLRGNRPGALGRRLSEAERKAREISRELAFMQEAANRYHEFVLGEMQHAVPEPDARIRAITTQGAMRGSFLGETARFASMYKSFPATIVATHLWRSARNLIHGEFGSRGRYVVELMVGMTLMGAVSYQSKNVFYGRDMGDPRTPEFWMQAFLQGGGLGIFGDFLMAEQNRFGDNIWKTLSGPAPILLIDSDALIRGNLQEYLRGEDTRLAPELVRFAKRYTPGTNLWYTRLALQRLFWDRLQELGDPMAHSSFRRMESRLMTDSGRGYWWKPGEMTPERMPEVAEAP